MPGRQYLEEGADEEQSLFGLMVVHYVLHKTGLLSPEIKTRYDEMSSQLGMDWLKHVEGELDINEDFIISICGLCLQTWSVEKTVVFILRGLDCPSYEKHLQEHIDSY
jgi:hypothetical protein